MLKNWKNSEILSSILFHKLSNDLQSSKLLGLMVVNYRCLGNLQTRIYSALYIN